MTILPVSAFRTNIPTHTIFALSLSALLFSGCSRSGPEGPIGDRVVEGRLVLEGQPLEGVSVHIDQVLNWRTITDAAGSFTISGVTEGDHVLSARKNLTNGEVVALQASLMVGSADISLGDIRLPKPVRLNSLDSLSMTADGVLLSWSRSDDEEFREYKIYRKTDAGLDETTGDLIYVTTDNLDTTYSDHSFSPGLLYFYRVFVLSSFGKLGGSNLVSIRTPAYNYIVNGGFESSSDGMPPDGWDYISADYAQPYISVTSADRTEGQRALQLSLVDSSDLEYGGMHEGFIRQQRQTFDIPRNIPFRFSFWGKSTIGKARVYIIFSDGSRKDFTVPSGTPWTQYSASFAFTDAISSYGVYVAVFEENRVDYHIDCLIDDIRLSVDQ